MRTCMPHLSSVLLFFGVFISTVMFCFIMNMFFHTSQDICMCTHCNVYVFIPYIFRVFYLYCAWYNSFVLACLEHLHLKIESSANTTLSYLIQKVLFIHYYLFCLFLADCCAIQCLCLPLPSLEHVSFLIYRG